MVIFKKTLLTSATLVLTSLAQAAPKFSEYLECTLGYGNRTQGKMIGNESLSGTSSSYDTYKEISMLINIDERTGKDNFLDQELSLVLPYEDEDEDGKYIDATFGYFFTVDIYEDDGEMQYNFYFGMNSDYYMDEIGDVTFSDSDFKDYEATTTLDLSLRGMKKPVKDFNFSCKKFYLPAI